MKIIMRTIIFILYFFGKYFFKDQSTTHLTGITDQGPKDHQKWTLIEYV